jgi:hypothetical protein
MYKDFQEQQNSAKAQILNAYSDASKQEGLQKAQEDDLEKGGEGSKGGKVIGHTKSGKAIYLNHAHSSHKDFTHEEHAEAAVKHGRLGDAATEMKPMLQHARAAIKHWEQHYEKGGKFKTADSKKLEAEQAKDDVKKSEDNDIEKGGEGSKGGKIIGHTKSGKAIYDKFSHKGHKEFTHHDHADARDVHNDKYKESAKAKEGLKTDSEEYGKHRESSYHHEGEADKHMEAHREKWLKHTAEKDIKKGEESNLDATGNTSYSVAIGTTSPDGKFIKSQTGWEKVTKDDIQKGTGSNGSVAIGTVSPDGKFQKGADGWNKIEK